ncbi:ECF transporter S component [Caldibacillus thermolactis]|uniref:Riboflavin transporter n=1 Tax=Pallidibacillus thermolactis TaxID=251051 RepID=A0ABT2WL81_9BACI|nr:ECF transporter S component [Pallidibacillus thermolactis]MCU9595726.1 ECF transporter S component [Pallidibacillus thermolactis]MCU9599763.1 ECF transporter S component [Pallidibacillus thermolactis subsp. kokeshiiformis]MED1674878.1 ECF transporter S component [Pallidibacillus thermolactis subsp. kokeshiiformis]
MKNLGVKAFVAIGMLSAIAYVLMLLNFPMPMFPTWLKIDFSDVPALVGAIIMGPAAGVLIELIKNLLDIISTGSESGIPVGHIANFTTGLLFILPTYFVYKKVQSKKGVISGLIVATIITTIGMSVLNYFVFFPMYEIFMGFKMPKLMIITAIAPFNFIKCIMISIVFIVFYNKMAERLNKMRTAF